MAIAEVEQRNLIVLTPQFTHVSTYNDSNQYGVIVHAHYIGSSAMHFYAGKIKQIGTGGIYCSNDRSISDNDRFEFACTMGINNF